MTELKKERDIKMPYSISDSRFEAETPHIRSSLLPIRLRWSV